MEIVLSSYGQDNTMSIPITTDFNALLEAHHDRLYWMIRKIVLVHDDTQDVLQNTWLKIHKGLPGFKGESKIDTWMFRIAYNESMRFLKQKKLHYRLDDVDSSYIESLKADSYFDGDKGELALHQALAKLKENERHIFGLKYFDALKFSQIAAMIDTNENSVKTLYYKAEKKLKQQLEKSI
ncbi:MAG: RNA polymerase sigma factor [Candidatus Arcticimaribacter sp.]